MDELNIESSSYYCMKKIYYKPLDVTLYCTACHELSSINVIFIISIWQIFCSILKDGVHDSNVYFMAGSEHLNINYISYHSLFFACYDAMAL